MPLHAHVFPPHTASQHRGYGLMKPSHRQPAPRFSYDDLHHPWASPRTKHPPVPKHFTQQIIENQSAAECYATNTALHFFVEAFSTAWHALLPTPPPAKELTPRLPLSAGKPAAGGPAEGLTVGAGLQPGGHGAGRDGHATPRHAQGLAVTTAPRCPRGPARAEGCVGAAAHLPECGMPTLARLCCTEAERYRESSYSSRMEAMAAHGHRHPRPPPATSANAQLTRVTWPHGACAWAPPLSPGARGGRLREGRGCPLSKWRREGGCSRLRGS